MQSRAARGSRKAPGRREKGHLRAVASHSDNCGADCHYGIYFVGGVVVERLISADGTPTVRKVQIVEYEQRSSSSKSAGHLRREYLIARVECPHGEDFTTRVALIHDDPTSQDPDANWGEVARVFAPDNPEFAYLYGARNDTESRHTNLKAAVKYRLPPDVAGQQLRLLAAMITTNATAWQLHLQLHGQPNVIDLYDTAEQSPRMLGRARLFMEPGGKRHGRTANWGHRTGHESPARTLPAR